MYVCISFTGTYMLNSYLGTYILSTGNQQVFAYQTYHICLPVLFLLPTSLSFFHLKKYYNCRPNF